MDEREMLATFESLKRFAKVHEVYQVTYFKGYRTTKQGDRELEVTFEIHDRGPNAGNLRYTVIATDEEGRMATGNPDVSIEMALRHVHWYDLDRDASGGQ